MADVSWRHGRRLSYGLRTAVRALAARSRFCGEAREKRTQSVSVISATGIPPPEAAGIDVFVTTGRTVCYHQQKRLAATSPSWPRQAPLGLTKHRLPTGAAAVSDGPAASPKSRSRSTEDLVYLEILRESRKLLDSMWQGLDPKLWGAQ
jgi:hypothetical protein